MKLIINTETIDASRIEAEAERLRPYYEQYVSEQGADGNPDQLLEWSKENIIEQVLMQQEAANIIGSISKEAVQEEYKKAKHNYEGMSKKEAHADILLQLKLDEMMKQISERTPAPTDKEIKEYYDAHLENFKTPEQVHAAHIERQLLPDNQQAAVYAELMNIYETIKKGADFDEIAASNSDCENFDLGWFARGQMVQEFDDVVFNLKPGAISDVFQTSFGYHIAKLYEKKPAGVMSLAEVKEQVLHHLEAENHTRILEDFVDKLKTKAEIIDE